MRDADRGADERSLPSAGELARYRLEAQHDLTRAWVADEVRLERLAAECADDLTLATDLEIAAERAERFAPAHPPELFLNRWCDVGGGLAAMLSMRFEGLDPARPFVDASLVSRRVETVDLPRLARVALELYGELFPLYLRLWDSRPDGSLRGTGPDRRFLAAPLAELRARPHPPPELQLKVAGQVLHYEDLVAAYEAVKAAHPAHTQQAQAQPREDMEETARFGTLFDVLVDDRWSGYVGALPYGDTLGMPAWVVQELVLTASARGRGCGHYLSEMLARELSEEQPVLVGTIHADNRGAIAAAARAHRRDVGGWIVVSW